MISSNGCVKVDALDLDVQWSNTHVIPLNVNISTKNVKFRADRIPTSPFKPRISNTSPKASYTVRSLIWVTSSSLAILKNVAYNRDQWFRKVTDSKLKFTICYSESLPFASTYCSLTGYEDNKLPIHPEWITWQSPPERSHAVVSYTPFIYHWPPQQTSCHTILQNHELTKGKKRLIFQHFIILYIYTLKYFLRDFQHVLRHLASVTLTGSYPSPNRRFSYTTTLMRSTEEAE